MVDLLESRQPIEGSTILTWLGNLVPDLVILLHSRCTLMNTAKFYGKYKMVALSIAAVAVLSGCNTVAGVGKDVQAAGESTTKAADKVSDKM